jgi:hypothetical protein
MGGVFWSPRAGAATGDATGEIDDELFSPSLRGRDGILEGRKPLFKLILNRIPPHLDVST